MVIGLTGGIGCGKSTVSTLFAEEGFCTIDCDQVVHDLLATDSVVIGMITDRFGREVLAESGGISRKGLGKLVFADSRALEDLESIILPETGKRWRAQVAAEPDKNWVVEIPLLFEKNLENRVDLTVCVFSDQRNQLERLAAKGFSQQEAMARIAKQLPLVEKAEKADFTLLNDGTLPFLQDQVRLLIQEIAENPLFR